MRTATREQFTSVDGLRVRHLEEGRGPAILLLHGASLGSSAEVWTPNLAAFAERGFRAIALDLPGFGLSDNPQDGTVGFRTQFVPAFVAALGLARVHLVGHSQSGRIALALGLEKSPCVEKIVIVGTGSLLPPLAGAAPVDANEGDEGGATEPALDDTRRALEETVFHRERITPEVVEVRHQMSLGKNFEAFLARQQAKTGGGKSASTPPWRRLNEVARPMRLIYGREDRGAAAERAALAKQLNPQLDLHLVDHCKHLVQWDAPEAFVKLCAEFFDPAR
jgi:2-hydroxy-6-oxonona-2,4-dienedioate hydrolase